MCHLQLQMSTKATTCNGKSALLHFNFTWVWRRKDSRNLVGIIINSSLPGKVSKTNGFHMWRGLRAPAAAGSRGDNRQNNCWPLKASRSSVPANWDVKIKISQVVFCLEYASRLTIHLSKSLNVWHWTWRWFFSFEKSIWRAFTKVTRNDSISAKKKKEKNRTQPKKTENKLQLKLVFWVCRKYLLG